MFIMFYYVYVLQSLKDKKFYIGFTTNLKNRVKDHNNGINISTRNRKPLKLIYFEGYINKGDALGREKFLKSGSGLRYLKKQMRNYLSQN